MAKNEAKEIKAWHYDVVRAPHTTEKSTIGSEFSKVTFKVATDATKPMIKEAVEVLFKVDVLDVNTIIRKPKVKRFKGRLGSRSAFKKAIITLAEGQSIDVASGL